MGRRAGCGVGIQWCTLVLSQNVNLVTLRGHTIKIIVMTWNKTCMQMSAACSKRCCSQDSKVHSIFSKVSKKLLLIQNVSHIQFSSFLEII